MPAPQVGLGVLLKDPRVFACYEDMHDTIWYSELGASLAILNAGFNLDSLMTRFRGVDWRDRRFWGCNAGYAYCLGLRVWYVGRQPDVSHVLFPRRRLARPPLLGLQCSVRLSPGIWASGSRASTWTPELTPHLWLSLAQPLLLRLPVPLGRKLIIIPFIPLSSVFATSQAEPVQGELPGRH